MGTIDTSLHRIYYQLQAGNAGLAIMEMETYLMAWPNQQSREKLETLRSEYNLMADYWMQGATDPERDEQYNRLLQRIYVLMANIAIHRHLSATSFLQQLHHNARQTWHPMNLETIRQEMENFVSEVAMLELEPEHTRKEKSLALYKTHQQQMNQLFNYMLTSNIWSEGTGRMMEELLVSPTIDAIDQQLLVSAVMLSLMNRFDIVKFRTLVDVYRRSTDEHVRQRALVGWVLGIDDDMLEIYPEQRTLIEELLKSKRTCAELTELQIQMIYTMDAEKDTNTVQQEIMPDILKNNTFRVTKNGIEEIEDDALEDVLHPDASEQRMEKLEQSFQRMIDMQRKGSDIFYGGFSQTKRFPFFYDISNWFVPFFIQHPDIAQFIEKFEDNRFLTSIMNKGPFCNSDKYSFVIAFQQVVNQLPESLRQAMKRGEATMGDMTMDHEEQQTPAFIRRNYLMDLYRFFRLFPNRQALINPFSRTGIQLATCCFFCSKVFNQTPLDAYKPEVVRVMKKHLYDFEAELLLDSFPESMRDVQYYLWKEDYSDALKLDPDNERALSARARYYFSEGLYEDANDDYERLLLLHPNKVSYMLNKAVCLVNMDEYEDALKLLYQLNYEHDEDVNIQRVLAWALICDGKMEQAEKLYQQLTSNDSATSEDYLNKGYCLWLMGRIKEADACFDQYFILGGDYYEAFNNREWLHQRGISDTDIRLMQAMVMQHDSARRAEERKGGLPF
ncbi:MAG: tetratricopeptide repeat protein [Prevotella sp.]|nr:tetratricopeptide repeat protein [Prevotella sp.]